MTNNEFNLLKRALVALEKIARYLESLQDSISDLTDTVCVIESRKDKDND